MASNRANRPHSSVVVAGAYGALFVVFLIASVAPYVRSVAAAQADIAGYKREFVSRHEKQQQLLDLQRRVQLVSLQTADYDRLVPTNQDLGPFLTELYKQLDEAGLKDRTVQAFPPTPLGKSQQLQIEIHGKGSFGKFHDFLTRLEHMDRLSSIRQLSIDAGLVMSGDLEVQVKLIIYNTKPGA